MGSATLFRMAMRSAILTCALWLAGGATASACPERIADLPAERQEVIREQLRRIAAGEPVVPQSQSSSHALELGVAALCLVSLFALRRSRPADPVSSHAG